jgi:hypothetical protein
MFMVKRLAMMVLALSLTCGGRAIVNSATAAPLQAAAQPSGTSSATDISSRRHHRRYHHLDGDRPYSGPYYYDRPYYYRPYPYASPAPFVFGLGFGP